MSNGQVSSPKPTLSLLDTVAVIVGIVIGAGIFKTPSLIAANVNSEGEFLSLWILGGAVTLVGALCYVELATAYPDAGGEYYYLARAFGQNLAFLFAWARLSVIQTGSIALLAFIAGDYLSTLFSLGQMSSSIYAAVTLMGLTALNAIGIQSGKWSQNLLTAAKLFGLLFVIVAGLILTSAPTPTWSVEQNTGRSYGLAAIFVLLTYGGWSEAAYLSAELREGQKNMALALVGSIGLITGVFVLVNVAYLKGLGLVGMAKSEVVAADLMGRAFGEGGAQLISWLIVLSVLGAMNGTIVTGARTNYALGKDVKLLGFLGNWNQRTNTPTNALITQGAIVLGLIFLGTLTRRGFATMVDYTAPVFWFFLFLVGVSLFILRRKEPQGERPFRVPFYPLTPSLFCATSLYLLGSSLVETGLGAMVGVGVVLAGVPLLVLVRCT